MVSIYQPELATDINLSPFLVVTVIIWCPILQASVDFSSCVLYGPHLVD